MPPSLMRLLSRAAAAGDASLVDQPAPGPAVGASAAASESEGAAPAALPVAMEETGDPLIDVSTFVGATTESCASTAHENILSTRATMEATVKINVMGLGRVRDLFDVLASQTAERIRECAGVEINTASFEYFDLSSNTLV